MIGKFSKIHIILILLIVFGALLRLITLSTLPIEPHRDEMAIGYNAYSLLQTGHDEHGTPWPIAFTSFGDYKLPGLIYTTMASIYLFGLNLWAIRLPTALAAIITIPAVYWLVRQIGWTKRVALIVALFITFDFWHITQARNTYEPILGLLYTVVCWSSWLAAQKDKRFYILTIISYILGSLTYNVPFLLLPMLLVGSWLIQQNWNAKIRKLLHLNYWQIITLSILGICFIGISLLTRGITAQKSNATVFLHPEIMQLSQSSVHASLITGIPSIVARSINHPIILSTLQTLKGYISAFDPTYLFFLGDHNPWHNLRSIGLGNMNPALLLVFLVGLYALILNYGTEQSKLTYLYLLVSPMISALTIDSPITNRLVDFHVAVLIVAAVGTNYWWQKISKYQHKLLRFTFYCFTSLYVGFFSIFIYKYYFLYNPLMEALWNPGLTSVLTEVQARANDYDAVYVSSDLELGYIFYAVYMPFDPQQFQSTAQWHTDGFQKVIAYDKYRFDTFVRFQDITPENVAQIFDNSHSKILIVTRGKPPDDGNEGKMLWQQKNYRGEWQWYIWETDLEKTIMVMQTFSASPERIKTTQYLQSCITGSCKPEILRTK